MTNRSGNIIKTNNRKIFLTKSTRIHLAIFASLDYCWSRQFISKIKMINLTIKVKNKQILYTEYLLSKVIGNRIIWKIYSSTIPLLTDSSWMNSTNENTVAMFITSKYTRFARHMQLQCHHLFMLLFFCGLNNYKQLH